MYQGRTGAIACCPLKEASKLHKAYPDTVVTLAADPTITAHYLLATLDPSAVSNIIFAERSRRAAINCRPHQRHAYQFTVTGLVFDQEGSHLFLIPRAKGRWFPPGGHVEEGEFPHEALIREIHEETGYTVTFLQQPAETGLRIENTYFVPHPYRTLLVDLGTHYHFDLLYLCRVASPPPEPTEYNGQWFLPTQALELPLPRELARILQELPKPLLHDI